MAVPYTLTNAGELVSTTPVTFSVDGTTIVREHTTLPGQILDGELMLDLSASDYALVYATPLESGQVTLHVTDPQLDRVQIAALSVPGDVGANTALSVTLVNVGDNRVEGVLRLATTFSEEYHPFELDSDSAQTVETLLSSATAEESGAYELVAQVRVNGQVVDEAAAGFVVAPPHFVVTAPSEIDVTAGQATTLLFGVQNTGGLASEATLTVDLDGIDIANQETWLAPGEAITLTYPFSIPFDLDSGQRQGSYAIAGITTTFDYQVEGYELSMTAQTDKPLYEAGETAVVTLYVNDDAGLGHPLIARLNGGGVESSQTFTPTGSAQLVFTATAGHEDDLLSYGLYAVSGRSLLLNTLRLRVRGGEIGLFTDKGVYQSGETVHLTVDALVSGTLSLRAPGLEDERHVEAGQTAIAFTLPNDMRAGTYEIEYRFNSREGSYLFEVEGLQVAVTEVVLGKRSYVAQDTVAATLQVMSNQDLPGTSVAWQVLNPQGEVLASADTPVNLTQGRNEVNLGALAFESTHAGTHALSFQVNDGERPLASGTELFDVTGPTLLGVYVPRAAYHAGRPIEVIFSTLGEGEASLRLWLNDNFINEAPVTLDGYGRTVVILGGLPIGVHQLEAELSGDGLTSKGATTVVVLDLPQVSIAAPNPSGEAGWYKEWPPRADLGASEEDAVILYHWDDEADAYNVGLPLVPAEGEHTLYAHAEGSDGATGPETARTFRVDTVPPETLVEIAGTQHEEGWYASPVTVTFVVSDATSGWAWSAYRLVGETDWLFYTQPFILSEDGTYILEYRSADVAGNEGATQTLEVTVVYGNDAPEATDDEATTDKIPPSR